MASTFFLAPAFKWYYHDSDGRLAVNGTMETFRASNHAVQKPVFSDAGGVFPYNNPITLDGTGGTPVPIYWEDDGVDRYYVVIRDAAGNLIASINDYPIVGTSGTPPPVTVTTDIENHIINGNFHLVGDTQFDGINTSSLLTPINPVPTGTIRVAPGSSTIGSERPAGSYIGGSTIDISGKPIAPTVLPGWLFIKAGGASLDDTIDFPAPLPGDVIPAGPSSNAPRYFRYKTTNALSTTELDLTYIIPGARSFSDETIQISFDAKADGPTPLTEFIFEQVFGTGGGASASVPTPNNFTFPNAVWDRISFQMVIPAVTGKTFGSNFDDFIRLRWRVPENTVGEFFLTNLQIQRGASIPTADFIYQSYNQTSARVLADLISGHLPKTGDAKHSYSSTPSIGWIVITNDAQTIGSSASTATFKGEQLRNLYRLWWTVLTQAQAHVAGGRGANADADFDANKTLRSPQICGRVFGMVGQGTGLTNRALGAIPGTENHLLSIGEIPPHTHTYNETDSGGSGIAGGAGFGIFTGRSTGSNGGGAAHQNMQPTNFLYVHIKL